MTREEIKNTIKENISCIDFLERSKGNMFCCPCPECDSGHGKNHTGAVKYYPETNTWYCHACDTGGDVIDLYQIINECDYNTAISEMAAFLGLRIDNYSLSENNQKRRESREKSIKEQKTERPISSETTPKTDYSTYYNQCAKRIKDPAAVKYLQSRGISTTTATAYGIGYDPKADPAKSNHPTPRLIIPTSAKHYIARRIDGGESFAKMNPKGSKPGVFNLQVIYGHAEFVFICEGIFDALSIIECGQAAISINSTSNAEKFIKQIETKPPTVENLIVCLDNDESGNKAAHYIEQELTRLNLNHITANISGDYKDPNEALTANKKEFEKAIIEAMAKAAARPDQMSGYINNLLYPEIERAKAAADITTGFNSFDKKSGGLYPGLYVLAATSSLGKTTFALQMADNLAAAGHDVLFFSLEQSRLELVTKSLSRIIYQEKGLSISALSFRKGYYQQELRQAAAIYNYQRRIGEHLSIIEGNFNCNLSFIGEYIRRYIRRNETRPIIFIDYLQILQSADTAKGATLRENINSTVTELKRISRENDLTVFVISSVNRANYLTPIDFESLKESGGIEYTADVIFGLQLQCLHDDIFNQKEKIAQKRERIKAAKRAEPREIELVCLKNRYGIANFTCNFDYYPQWDLFEIVPDKKRVTPRKAGRKL